MKLAVMMGSARGPTMGLLGAEEAKFAGGAVGAKAVGEVEGSSGACSDGKVWTKSTEGEEAGGFVEAEAGSQLAGGGSEDAAAEGGVEAAETVEFDGDGGLAGGGADGAAPSPDGLAGEQELGEDTA
jgi:hypothetical protein